MLNMTEMSNDTQCDICMHVFKCKAALIKHQNNKFKCNEGKYPCRACGKTFQHPSSRCHHQKTCTGPKLNPIDTLSHQVQALQTQIAALQNEGRQIDSLPDIKSVLDLNVIDIKRPQLYFGVPGPLLVALSTMPAGSILIKAGISTNFPTRRSRHAKDFGGFRWLDSIVICNPVAVEKRLKEWLRANSMLIKCKTNKKKSKDSEIFAIKSQAEYDKIVKAAQDIANEDARQEQEARARESANKLESDTQRELEMLRTRLRILELEKAMSSV